MEITTRADSGSLAPSRHLLVQGVVLNRLLMTAMEVVAQSAPLLEIQMHLFLYQMVQDSLALATHFLDGILQQLELEQVIRSVRVV